MSAAAGPPRPGAPSLTVPPRRVPSPAGQGASGALALVADPLRRRLRASVDMDLALRLFNARADGDADEEARVARCGADLRRALDALNAAAAEELAGHLRAAVDNCLAGVRYLPRPGDSRFDGSWW